MNEDMISVKTLASKGGSVLVEWLEDGQYLKRGFIPRDIIDEGGYVPAEELALAIPYGSPWSEIITFEASALHLEDLLRKKNIWNLDDLSKNPNKAISALQSVYSMDYAALKHAARQFSKESGNG